MPKTRAVAFFLPQFHPTPENDRWWGPGFTEWRNVARGRRLFPGHHQPKIPRELGFYDLRLAETRDQQAALARRARIEAFAYWHYWFAGRRLLSAPVDAILESGAPPFPFMLAWANRTWQGIWHGADGRTLITQTYPADDIEEHGSLLLRFMSDDRYLRVADRPVLYLLEPLALPRGRAYIDNLRDFFSQRGEHIYLVGEYEDVFGVRSSDDVRRIAALGLDGLAYVRFPIRHRKYRVLTHLGYRLGLPKIYVYSRRPLLPSPNMFGGQTRVFPTVLPNWDNTPRAQRRGVVITRGSPALFERHLRAATEFVSDYPEDERFVFIKSWNEWAEGNFLEPEVREGLNYIEACRRALNENAREDQRTT